MPCEAWYVSSALLRTVQVPQTMLCLGASRWLYLPYWRGQGVAGLESDLLFHRNIDGLECLKTPASCVVFSPTLLPESSKSLPCHD